MRTRAPRRVAFPVPNAVDAAAGSRGQKEGQTPGLELGLSDSTVREIDVDVRTAHLPQIPFTQLTQEEHGRFFPGATIARRTLAHESNSSISFSETGEKR